MDSYTKDQIVSIESAVAGDGSLTLKVMPILETAHYLAGANLAEAGGARQVTLVRCGLGKSCAAEFAATVTPETRDPYAIAGLPADLPVAVRYADGAEEVVFTP